MAEREKEDDVRLTYEVFVDALKVSPVGFAIENLEGRPLFVNPALCSMLGFSEQEMLNKHCVDFSPREDADKDWAFFQQLRAGSIDHYSLDKRYFRGDGSVMWGRLSISLMNEHPTPLVVAMVQDITDRKLAEEELARTNERLQLAIECGSVGGWDFNLKTDENVWFGKAHAQLGMTPDETVGSRREFWSRVHQDDRERLKNAIRVARDTHEAFIEDFRVVWQGGTIHWLRSRGQYRYSPNGEPERMLGISVDITQSKEAERAVRESEARFQLVANAAPVKIWMSGTDKLCTYFNQRWLTFTGHTLEAELGDGWVQGVHPEDLQRCLNTYTESFDRREPYQVEYRLRRYDGEYRWILASGVPRSNPDGSFAGYIGSAIDITERKLAEQALSTVSKKLLEAQEQERTRIARELHDDINQRIALLALDMQSLQQNLQGAAAELRKPLENAIQELEDLGIDVQALSHRLHSSKLEYLGLASAIASFCGEVSKRQGVKIDFHSENIPKDLPREISLSLFRVVEEGLQNAIKHSGSRQFQVSLRRVADEIELTVHDAGIGFDPEQAMKGHGLGLTSMTERLKLINGHLSVDSQRQSGTTIRARVPLSSEMKSAAVSG